MDVPSRIVKIGGGVAVSVALALVAWRLMSVSTGDLPVAPPPPVMAVEDPPVDLPEDAPIRVQPRPSAPTGEPDFVAPVLTEDDPPPPDGGRSQGHPGGAEEVRSAVEAADAAYDVVLDLLPLDAKASAQPVIDSSRATLAKLSTTSGNGQIPVEAALAAVEHQRKVVSRRLSTLVTPEQAASIDKALGVGEADAP